MDYEKVNLQDYVSNNLVTTNNENEYLVTSDPKNSQGYYITLKADLITGTYKLVFKLYDGETYVGEAYEYIVIK